MAEDTGLSDQERAELEALRAEKAAREKASQAQAERAELERLRAQRNADQAERAQMERDAAARERGRKLMEPDDDDLTMSVGQKVVIAAVLLVAVAWAAVTFLG